MSAYLILKYIHVLAAIVAVGTNATYGVWMTLGAAQPDSLRAILRGVRFLDTRVANPAYGLLLITGLAMLYAGHLAIGTPWIATGLGLFIVGRALGFTVVPGGVHAGGLTHNALIPFADGRYLELLALTLTWKRRVFRMLARSGLDRVMTRRSPLLGRALRRIRSGEGLADFALV